MSNSGVMSIFRLSADPKVAMQNGAPLRTMDMGASIYGTPVLANNVLYVPTMYSPELLAIAESANDQRPGGRGGGSSPDAGD